MLEINNLHVEVGGRAVLRGVTLHIKPGETFILFGPNGSGKTTLLMSLMGFMDYKVTGGSIVFKGKDITDTPMHERARLGMGMSFQRPPTVHGLPVRALLAMCGRGKEGVDVEALAATLRFDAFLGRDINDGFSGGEIKRSELLQLMVQQPDLVLFDEPESGVDMENMALLGQAAKQLLGGGPACNDESCPRNLAAETRKSGLIITHTGYILDYVHADRAQVMYEGKLCCEGRPLEILEHIRQAGYRNCLYCSGGIQPQHVPPEASRA